MPERDFYNKWYNFPRQQKALTIVVSYNVMGGCSEKSFPEVVNRHELLPHVYMVDSLIKRWINGTHLGKISQKHLEYYLEEFAFRFNRKLSNHRGKLFYRLMQQSVDCLSSTYKQITSHLLIVD